jgi:hypothetical protein
MPQNIDALIADLAARQHGVISRGQLRRAGLSDRSIDRRLSRAASIRATTPSRSRSQSLASTHLIVQPKVRRTAGFNR